MSEFSKTNVWFDAITLNVLCFSIVTIWGEYMLSLSHRDGNPLKRNLLSKQKIEILILFERNYFSQFNSILLYSFLKFHSIQCLHSSSKTDVLCLFSDIHLVEFLLGNTNDVLLDLVALFQSRPCMKLFHSKKGHRLSIWKKSHWLKEFLVFFKSSRFYSIPMFIWEE